jgi:hypothetical protein
MPTNYEFRDGRPDLLDMMVVRDGQLVAREVVSEFEDEECREYTSKAPVANFIKRHINKEDNFTLIVWSMCENGKEYMTAHLTELGYQFTGTEPEDWSMRCYLEKTYPQAAEPQYLS